MFQAAASAGVSRWPGNAVALGVRARRARLVAAGAAGPVKIKVEGMVCGGCSTRVQGMLDKSPMVEKAEVSLEKGEAVVHLKGADGSGAKETVQKLVREIENLGFDAKAA